MRLLLHTCCAPCLIYPLERLRAGGYEVEAFFYNPNVHPFNEYKNRKQAVIDYSRIDGVSVVYPEYKPAEFFQSVNLREVNPGRCRLCWSLRLTKAAQAAKERGFDSFSTTLLVSPYQDQELIKNIGRDISASEGVDFYYEDFRPGFRKAHEQARSQGMYCQNYCGCIYSEIERHKK
jgi:epoxyqueuosine reductase